MKLKLNKKHILVLCIFAVVILLAAVVPWGTAAASAKQLARHLFDRFAYSYRFKIGYFLAFILLAGTFVLLLKKPKAREEVPAEKGPPAAPFKKDIKKLK